MRVLRPHQEKAIELLRQSFRNRHKRPILCLPTGAGKTAVAAAIIRMAREKGTRVMFTVPALSLVDQTVQRFYEDGLHDVGVIQAQHIMTDYSKPIQVASIQTLIRRGFPEDIGMVVCDEAHLQFEGFRQMMSREDLAHLPFIGLTATPGARGMGRYWDDLIVPVTMKELIDASYLSPFRVFAPYSPDLSKVRIVAGEYHEGDLSRAMNKGHLIGDVVRTWKRLGEDRQTVLFAVDRAHAKHLQAAFVAEGVSTEYIDAEVSILDREAIKRRFHNGDVRVVVNIATMIVGVDWDFDCLIDAAPTKSVMRFVQKIGRVLRYKPGKEALIIDHSDNHLSLGFVTDIEWKKLDNGAPKTREEKEDEDAERKERLPKKCPSCSTLIPVGVYACGACGWKGGRENTVTHIDGELIELSAVREKRQRGKANREMTWHEKQAFMADLKAYALSKGYREGWAAMKYKDRVGVFPNDPRVKYVSPSDQIKAVTKSWIVSQQIRWAKSKRLS